jgi:WD40-like Beta Propeller Repeat
MVLKWLTLIAKTLKSMRAITLIFLGLLSIESVFSQPKQRKLGPALNSPSFNYQAPYVSLDGNTLLFTYDYTEDGQPAAFVSLRTGVDWKEPIAIPKKITAQSFSKAGTLSPDGRTVYLTSARGGSLGGFDIWMSNFNGTSFSDLTPIGAAINSTSNEGSPTLSPDGSMIFFMRCNKMTATSAEECKIMMSKKGSNGLWGAPAELPSVINAGNSQMPRMLADGQTLLFASNKHTPNKGGLDFYSSTWIDGQWSAPINLDFANTTGDDLFASSNSLGMSLLRDAPGVKRSELVEFIFPPELKPKATTRVSGVVSGVTDASKAMVNLVDMSNGKTHASLRPDAKGNFVCYVPEGKDYGLFIDPPMENMSFFMKRYDYRTGKILPNDRVSATLKVLSPGDEIELSGVSFKEFSSDLDAPSTPVLQRVGKLIWGNSALKFEVDVSLYGYSKSSIQQPDLTEVITNTVVHKIADTVVYEKEFQIDSVTTEMRDSIAIEMHDSIAVEYTYHNDRTEKQAQAVLAFLYKQAVKPDRVSYKFSAVEEMVADKRRIVVRLRAR